MANLTFHDVHLKMITYNMHGFNQGYNTIAELIKVDSPDVMLLQEHWLTPANLSKFDIFNDYFSFGCSALSESVASGILIGRPYGGVITLIKNELRNSTQTIHCADRYVLVKVHNYVLANIYLPCTGTADRLSICQDVVNEIWSWCDKFTNYHLIVAGDFNVNLDKDDIISNIINSFISEHSLIRCDDLFPASKVATYVNDALGHQSNVDYIVTSSPADIVRYEVLDVDINFSDHLPLLTIFACSATTLANNRGQSGVAPSTQLRWDHADKISYYEFTRCQLQAILDHIQVVMELYRNGESLDYCLLIQQIYDDIIVVLNDGANRYVPRHRKNFYKFWWDQELDLLKEESIKSHSAWKSAGRPRSGPYFNKYRSDKLAYKLRIRSSQQDEVLRYTNDLNDALLQKQGNTFWNCWRSKFSSKTPRPLQIDNLTDDSDIADHFAYHFQNICTIKTADGNKKLQDMYTSKRSSYSGTPFTNNMAFTAELVEDQIINMKRGKAAGLDNLSAEHLQHCHPCLPAFLARLFNLIIETGTVPDKFGLSYTIPLLKANSGSMSKSLTASDFRGISISPVLSKVFENCILQRYKHFFITSDNQFGFKKLLGCSHAIYTVRQSVEYFTKSGTTVNLCALDLSKAFDKVNHFGLYIKLMNRAVPIMLLKVLEHWFSIHTTCVRFGSAMSSFVSLKCGVRQGGVLSPHLFSVYIDDVIEHISSSKYCCDVRFVCVNIFMYADDLILMSPSVTVLQNLFKIVEEELMALEMSINPSKSSCIRFGPRYDASCANITAHDGSVIPWVKSIRYLGIEMKSSRIFKCVFDSAKKSFYKSFNAIFGKIGRSATADVIMHLLKVKCLPVLLYGLNACPLSITEYKSLDFVIFRTLAKIFETFSQDIINECRTAFNLPLMSDTISKQKINFLVRYFTSENLLCKAFALNADSEIKSLRQKLNEA